MRTNKFWLIAINLKNFINLDYLIKISLNIKNLLCQFYYNKMSKKNTCLVSLHLSLISNHQITGGLSSNSTGIEFRLSRVFSINYKQNLSINLLLEVSELVISLEFFFVLRLFSLLLN